MSIRQLILLFLLLACSATAAQRWVPYQLLDEEELELPKLSAIGTRVLKDPGKWLIGKSEHFIVFAETRHELQNAIDDAENAFKRAGEWFDLDLEGMPTSLLVFVKEEDEWNRLMKGYGLRRDSLAMQLGRELYFKDDSNSQRRPERISHEAIQLALNLSFRPLIALWLEEGLASHYGWLCAIEMYNTREIRISRKLPVIESGYLFDLEDLLETRQYPEAEVQARAFYRQSEELVAVLSEKLGQDLFARFVHRMSAGRGTGIEVFREATGMTNEEIADLEREVRRRCTETTSEDE